METSPAAACPGGLKSYCFQDFSNFPIPSSRMGSGRPETHLASATTLQVSGDPGGHLGSAGHGRAPGRISGGPPASLLPLVEGQAAFPLSQPGPSCHSQQAVGCLWWRRGLLSHLLASGLCSLGPVWRWLHLGPGSPRIGFCSWHLVLVGVSPAWKPEDGTPLHQARGWMGARQPLPGVGLWARARPLPGLPLSSECRAHPGGMSAPVAPQPRALLAGAQAFSC